MGGGPEDLIIPGTGQGQGGQLPTPQSAAPPAQSPTQVAATPQTPAKSTSTNKSGTGKSVVKALPTVRDHTTDQPSPEGDEYIPREIDEAGERKVGPNGEALDSREYKCRTFYVSNRGVKLFMLATECARVLGYRDSYLLFNKNRSLFKIIASQAEKDDLISQDILPYSYRSRQIAIVTAKSMFRQFGSRVIVDGRRVRDDYWEAKAKKQGFTEEDLAGDKRPGGAKAAREAAASEAANAAVAGHPQDNIIYNHDHGAMPVDAHGHPQMMHFGSGGPMPPPYPSLPMIHPAPNDRDYAPMPKGPRQEITGPAYQDRTQPTSMAEIMNQAAHGADFSRVLNQQSSQRKDHLKEFWNRDISVPSPTQQATETPPPISQPIPSPNASGPGHMPGGYQALLPPHQASSQMMNPLSNQQGYSSGHTPQSSNRGMPAQMRQDSMGAPHRSSSLPFGGQGHVPPSPSYPYQPSGIYHPQQSSLTPHHNMAQYSPQQPTHSQSPHPSQSPHHPSQQAPPPQLHLTQSSGATQPPSMGYPTMPQLGQQGGGYNAMMGAGRGMYQQPPGQGHSHYMQGQGGAPSMQAWNGSQQSAGNQQGWPQY